MLWLILVIAVVVFLLVRGRFWPWGRCPSCRGRKGRGIGSTDRAFNRCGHCGGKGERIRPLAMLWLRHRETARKLKQDRSKK